MILVILDNQNTKNEVTKICNEPGINGISLFFGQTFRKLCNKILKIKDGTSTLLESLVVVANFLNMQVVLGINVGFNGAV